jgi:general secretion pathway protein D
MRTAPVLLALLLCGCATSGAFRAGQRAEDAQDWDRAVLEYSRALKNDPGNARYRSRLERARLRAAQEHLTSARRLAARGLYKEALDEYRLSADLNPAAVGVAEEMRRLEMIRTAGSAAGDFDAMKERVRERALPGLALSAEAREPMGLSFRNASLREVYQALGRVAGVNFVFDPQFQDTTVTLDLRDVPFEQALTAVASVGRTFHRVVDSRVVSVIPDTPSKRRDNEQQVVKTFFLSNADLKETIDLLRIVLGARRVAPLPGSNALTISDTPDKVSAAERIIDVVDKQRAEVMVDVEILEVNRTRLRDYGIEITSGTTEGGVAGAIFPRTTVEEVVRDNEGNPVFTRQRPLTLDDNPFRPENLLITSLPGVIYRLLKTDGSTRLLANPQLRTSEGQTAQARFGDQVPVPVTVFTPIAQGGIAQQPVTSFEYKSVGVNIDLTPRVHHDGDVTLTLKLEISSLGPLFQNNPTFRSRNVTSVIRLRDGETTILAGLIQDEERTTVTGLPGLGDVPVLGRIFSRNRKEATETDIVMTMTPHIVRRLDLKEEDLRSFSLGSEGAPVLFDVPAVPSAAPTPRPDLAPRVEPIRPPAVPSPSPLPVPTPQP